MKAQKRSKDGTFRSQPSLPWETGAFLFVAVFIGILGTYRTLSTSESMTTDSVLDRLKVQTEWGSESILAQITGTFERLEKNPNDLPRGVFVSAQFEFDEASRDLIWRSGQKSNLLHQDFDEKTYLTHLKNELSKITIKDDQILAYKIKPTATDRREWMSFSKRSNRNAAVIESYLADPQEFLNVFRKMSDSSNQRAYLLSSQGKVLAHSQPDYVGADFKRSELYSQGISFSFDDKPRGMGVFRAADQQLVHAAFIRVGSLPFSWVVEDLESPSQGLLSWEKIVVTKNFWMSLAAILLFLWIGTASFGMRLRKKWENLPPDVDRALSALAPLPALKPLPALMNHRAELQAREAATTLQTDAPTAHSPQATKHSPQEIYLNYPNRIEAANSAGQVLEEFLDSVTLMTESPAVFFVWNAASRSAALAYDSGFPSPPKAHRFTLSDAALGKIHACSRNSKIATLESYEPLCNVIRTEFGVAFIEAWAMTDSTGRFIGVFVLLQPNVQSSTQRNLIVRMMKMAADSYGKKSIPTSPREPTPDHRRA